jgi:hypothetical protein
LKRLANKIQGYQFFIQKILPFIRFFIAFIAVVTVAVISFKSIRHFKLSTRAYAATESISSAKHEIQDLSVISPTETEYIISRPTDEDFQIAEQRYDEKIRRIEEERKRQEEIKRQERQRKVKLLQDYLVKRDSPMAGYAELILTSCEKYGSHYCKFFISIAGVESGLGRVCPAYNAWGWGKKRFASWNDSIPYVADQIAQKYYLKGYNTFEKLAYSSYGPKNPESWIDNLYSFYNELPPI